MLKQMIRFFELTPFVQVPQWSESSEPDRWHWPESAAAITWPPDCSSSESSTSMTGGLRHGAFAVTSFTHLSRFSACWRRLRFKGHQPKIRGMQEDIQTSTNANHPRSNHARTKSLIHIPWVIHITIHIPSVLAHCSSSRRKGVRSEPVVADLGELGEEGGLWKGKSIEFISTNQMLYRSNQLEPFTNRNHKLNATATLSLSGALTFLGRFLEGFWSKIWARLAIYFFCLRGPIANSIKKIFTNK